MRTLRRIIRGCRTLPAMGPHPGSGFMLAFLAMGAMAGAQAGWRGALGGASFMAAFIVPLYLYGAYSRAVEQDRFDSDNDQ